MVDRMRDRYRGRGDEGGRRSFDVERDREDRMHDPHSRSGGRDLGSGEPSRYDQGYGREDEARLARAYRVGGGYGAPTDPDPRRGYGRDEGYRDPSFGRERYADREHGLERGERYRNQEERYRPEPSRGGRGGEHGGGFAGPDITGMERIGFGAMGAYPGPERNFAGPYGYGVGERTERHGDRRGFLERAGDEIASWFGSGDAERRRQRDAQEGDAGAQHHRGRGPRSYRRSDERILEDACDRLADDPYLDASDVEVRVLDREVTLAGTVRSRFAKRHAEDLVETVSGVTHVQNNLRVQRPDYGGNAVQGSQVGVGSSLTAHPSTASPGTQGGTYTLGAEEGPTTPPSAANAGPMGAASPSPASRQGETPGPGASGGSPGAARRARKRS